MNNGLFHDANDKFTTQYTLSEKKIAMYEVMTVMEMPILLFTYIEIISLGLCTLFLRSLFMLSSFTHKFTLLTLLLKITLNALHQ